MQTASQEGGGNQANDSKFMREPLHRGIEDGRFGEYQGNFDIRAAWGEISRPPRYVNVRRHL